MDLRELSSMFSFERELLDKIEQLNVIEIDPGEVILKEREFIKVVPLVLEGSIKLRKMDPTGREIIFYHIEPGESCILSITSCLHEKESHAEAIIERKTRLIVVEAEHVRSWMNQFSSWRKFIVKLYYERMAELMTLLDSVIFKSVDDRLIRFLKEKATGQEVEITHQQLASELGTAREVISRLLKQMERDEYISLERGKIRIIKPL
ncbi:MAG: Crp/Fnr family transcriptional regulator [Eudoraea sp.]|nr:Crp/Fnr family transcriptional regulator [Eudoraea sp.]